MKSIAKILLVGAVAVTAIALTAAPSEAARKKASTCTPTTLCAGGCSGSSCRVNICGGDGKWYQAWITPVCLQPTCPAKC
jgi:hypothetical protein